MLFEVRNISKSYKNIPVVENFSLEVEQGDMIALVGKRKRGKTTLMQMLAGIIPIDAGEIFYNEKLVGKKGKTAGLCKLRRRKIGYITTEAILMPDMTVYDNLLMALSHSRGSMKVKKARAKEVLRNLGLKGKGRFFPKELNTLDRQKVCVARAIITEPELLICDEPTDILEGYGAEQLMDILEILNSAGYTIIISTHSKRIASRCRKVYPIHEGLDLTGLGENNSEDNSYEDGTELNEEYSENKESSADDGISGDENSENEYPEDEYPEDEDDYPEDDEYEYSQDYADYSDEDEAAAGLENADKMKKASKKENPEENYEENPSEDDGLPQIDMTDIF
ncbi:MAG: ABC transporter ATP-binding protein [Lachnospiraceae bacterium]